MLTYIIRLPWVKSQAPAQGVPWTPHLWRLLWPSTAAMCQSSRSLPITSHDHAAHARP